MIDEGFAKSLLEDLVFALHAPPLNQDRVGTPDPQQPPILQRKEHAEMGERSEEIDRMPDAAVKTGRHQLSGLGRCREGRPQLPARDHPQKKASRSQRESNEP